MRPRSASSRPSWRQRVSSSARGALGASLAGMATGSTSPVATGARVPTARRAAEQEGPSKALQVPSGSRRRSTASPAGTLRVLAGTRGPVADGAPVVEEVAVLVVDGTVVVEERAVVVDGAVVIEDELVVDEGAVVVDGWLELAETTTKPAAEVITGSKPTFVARSRFSRMSTRSEGSGLRPSAARVLGAVPP